MSKAAPEPGGPRYANCKNCGDQIVKGVVGGPWVHIETDEEKC